MIWKQFWILEYLDAGQQISYNEYATSTSW